MLKRGSGARRTPTPGRSARRVARPAPGRRSARSRSGRRRRSDPELAGEVQARLRRLAGQEQVEARRGRLRAGAWPPPPETIATRSTRPGLRRRRAARGVDPFADACEELSPVVRCGSRPPTPISANGAVDLDAELAARAARCCRPPDGRRARGGSRRASIRRRTAPRSRPRDPRVDHARLVVPEQAVVDDHELRARLGRALEQLQRRRDGADDLRHLVGAGDLHALRARSRGTSAEVEQLGREGEDLVAARHPRFSQPAPAAATDMAGAARTATEVRNRF